MQTTSSDVQDALKGDPYAVFLQNVRERFEVMGQGPLFTTDAEGLFEVFLAALPESLRQHYTCRACQRFIETYGGLVVINERGVQNSPIWESTPEDYLRKASEALWEHVKRAKVTGVFLSSERLWGTGLTFSKRHECTFAHLRVANSHVFPANPLKTAHQAMAEKREEYGMTLRALAEFSASTVTQAVALLQTEQLYRGEKCLGVAQWLANLHEARARTNHERCRENITWRAVASAPVGFAHARSSMIGTLLLDIAEGLPFAEVSRRFSEKMNPLQYQRPQAPPSAGNRAQAEKVIEALGTAGALARRFARLEDLETVWTPPKEEREGKGAGHSPGPVFGHLAPKGEKDPPARIDTPPVTMTWEKFLRTVLPDAALIEHGVGTGPFYAFVTAVNPESPPILQWDQKNWRNQVSWYTYPYGSHPSSWGLTASWAHVTAVSYFPFMWHGGKSTHHGEGVLFVLQGCRDQRSTGGALFPELMKSDYHGIRSSIEAYSRSAKLEGREEASACGVAFLRKGQEGDNLMLRVTGKTGCRQVYKLDWWG